MLELSWLKCKLGNESELQGLLSSSSYISATADVFLHVPAI
jgi:hypothetical protein